MPKLSAQLTITQIKNLKPKDKPYFVGDGNNLLVKIMPSGDKFFIYEFRDGSSRHRLTLGKFGEISLSEARDKKAALKGRIQSEAGLQKDTFKSVFEAWIKTKEVSKRTLWIRHKFEQLFLLEFGSKSLKDISRKDIVSALEPMLDRKESVKKLFGALNSFYKFALLYEKADHNIIADIDKKTFIGKQVVNHYAHFSDKEEIVNLIKAINNYFGDKRVKTCALFMLYTAVRGANARFATWSEIDFEKSIWSIPASKMKTGKAHEVFLSHSVKKLLLEYQNSMPVKSELIFPSLKSLTRPISDNTIRSMLRNLGYSNEQITPHGFRATFSTIAHENIDLHGFNSDIIELCLAHTEQNKIKAAYNHAKNLKARAGLMQWWSDYLDDCG